VRTSDRALVVNVVRLPNSERPLPTPADLDRVMELPLYQLFVVGRSGSGLIHAYLDGHPDVIHVPHLFKFFDFVVQHDGILERDPEAIVDAFSGWQPIEDLFDSARSVIIGGRLGDGMSTFVVIDKSSFRSAFLSSVAGRHQLDARRVFRAIVLAFAWCIGQPVKTARIVFQHLHHGDWLWPDRLIERYNVPKPPARALRDAMRPVGYVLSVREPQEAARSVWSYAEKLGYDDSGVIAAKERYFRLLLQDWDRLRLLTRAGVNAKVVRIEDLRRDARGVMADCARWMGIDDSYAGLGKLTYFGFDWYGDIFTKASREIQSESQQVALCWQDRLLIDVLVGDEVARRGYAPERTGVDRIADALKMSLMRLWPSPTVWRTSGAWPIRYLEALRYAGERAAFVNAFRRLDARAA
jgi:hypothetical protein